MRDTLIMTVESVDYCLCNSTAQINGKWVPARPLGYPAFWYRVKATWMVFTGKADALVWPEGQ